MDSSIICAAVRAGVMLSVSTHSLAYPALTYNLGLLDRLNDGTDQDATENEPDFRTMNDAYIALYDKNGGGAFVNQVLHMLKKFRLCVK